ncbi:hypothetical protein ROZALSC1DRAFT_29337 [Rozella allomycis CSF55]|uniref:Uncharacterized protein n=1 Tax=Rozella allomycis (strain CSF55) TaxID=988480 RepID=A0A4P9YHI9_ROZAC|nr:hypothetical protein ROZALSC1DRAFT_29344 [Rozella allomycis CSF55]RKP19027.1 hypothetical protein ROZALSC1DRAFT_29337 [Rozella allomycis CSF55]
MIMIMRTTVEMYHFYLTSSDFPMLKSSVPLGFTNKKTGNLTHIRLYCFTPRHSLDFVEELNAPLEFVEIILEENEAYYCGFGKDNSKTYKALSEKYPNARILCDKTYTNWHDIADDLLLILKRPFNSD